MIPLDTHISSLSADALLTVGPCQYIVYHNIRSVTAGRYNFVVVVFEVVIDDVSVNFRLVKAHLCSHYSITCASMIHHLNLILYL